MLSHEYCSLFSGYSYFFFTFLVNYFCTFFRAPGVYGRVHRFFCVDYGVTFFLCHRFCAFFCLFFCVRNFPVYFQVPKGATESLASSFQPLSSLVTVEDAPQPMEL